MSQPTLIQQAYRYQLNLSSEQEVLLIAWAGASRYWFNQGLGLVKQRLEERQLDQNIDVPWSYKSLCCSFRAYERNSLAPWQQDMPCGTYQAGFEGLGAALQNFSKGRQTGRNVGFPHFKRKGTNEESIIFQRAHPLDSRHLALHSQLGPVKTHESLRKLTRLLNRDEHARILRGTIKRAGSGWSISFTVIRSKKERQARRNEIVGIDLGLTKLATLSTGEWVENGRHLTKALTKLRRLQRQTDRQRRMNNPGNYQENGQVKPRNQRREWIVSQRQIKIEERVRRLHQRVANLRHEQAHQLTTWLTREYAVIGAETLMIENMKKNKRLARHISDAGWGMIRQQMQYKTDWSDGSRLVLADPFYPSSKTCSECDSVKTNLSISERVFTCENLTCLFEIDRDLNAAFNLAEQARQVLQAEGIVVTVAQANRETLVLVKPTLINAREG